MSHIWAEALARSAYIVPVCALSPLLGGRAVPAPARIAVALALAWASPAAPDPARALWAGLVVALHARLLLGAMQAAGHLLDLARGTHHVESIAPLGEDRSAPLGALVRQVTLVVWVELGGISDAVLSPAAFDPLESWRSASGAAMALVWPGLVACSLVDLSFGALARVAPSLNPYVGAMGSKSLVGLIACLELLRRIATELGRLT